MNIKYISKGFILVLFLVFIKTTEASAMLIDSIGVENNNGKQVILHRVVAKESYYSLSRQYLVQPNDIIAFNNNKSLKIGDIIKIPTDRNYNTSPTSVPNQNPETINSPIPTEYKVGAGETLYTISKRFQVTIAEIVRENNLKNEQDIKAGQTIRIPQESSNLVAETSDEIDEELEILEEPATSLPLPSNRYGLRLVDEKGIGVWMDGLNADEGNMLALHKTAPIGTVVKITNPMTQRTTFAKVVGKYTDNNNTRDAVIVISKSTADLLGILDKRFLIDISYGVPVN
jgi:LysM repeat protein